MILEGLLNRRALEERIKNIRNSMSTEDTDSIKMFNHVNKPSWYKELAYNLFGSYGAEIALYRATGEILHERK